MQADHVLFKTYLKELSRLNRVTNFLKEKLRGNTGVQGFSRL
jgi:hypothetical protein